MLLIGFIIINIAEAVGLYSIYELSKKQVISVACVWITFIAAITLRQEILERSHLFIILLPVLVIEGAAHAGLLERRKASLLRVQHLIGLRAVVIGLLLVLSLFVIVAYQ